MIDDQAKETIPTYTRAQLHPLKSLLPSSSKSNNGLSLALVTSTLDMLNPV